MVVFRPIFVADTKIIYVYNFVAPLILAWKLNRYQSMNGKILFFSLKLNKSPGHDRVSFNVIKKGLGELCEPLNYFFNLLIVKGIFPDDLKIEKVTSIYKADNSNNVINYK